MTEREQVRDRDPLRPEAEGAGHLAMSAPESGSGQRLDTSAPGAERPAAAEPESPGARAARSPATHPHPQAQTRAREDLRADGEISSFVGRTVVRFEETADGYAIVEFEVPPNFARTLRSLWPSLLDVRLEGWFSGQKAAVTLRTPVGPPTKRERKEERRKARREAR